MSAPRPAAPLLTIDRGNTTLDVMLHGPAPRRARLQPDDLDGLLALLGEPAPARCAAVTVVPGGLDAVEAALARRGVALAAVGRDLGCPLRLDYATPQTLGADRWLGALAAHRRHGAAVVVDCGSATTVNLVTGDGTFRGGAIAPGLPALVAGLRQVTPHLPAADPSRAAAVPARSSAAAVDAGCALAFCGAVERLVAAMVAAAGEPVTVVLTGGHAGSYLRHGQLRPVHEPDLVHGGLRLLLEAQRAGAP